MTKLGFLSLKLSPEDYLVIYRTDNQGKVVVDSKEVAILKVSETNNSLRLNFETNNNFKYVRYNALKTNGPKEIFDIANKKINKLESITKD